MFIFKKGHQPGVYMPLRALFLVLDWIFFILAGNEDIYKSLDEFTFGLNSATDFGVSCP